jgi:hypothetical protein
MQHYRSLQTYVPPLIADWIREQARVRKTSVSVVVRELLVAAWNREIEPGSRPSGTDPARQLVFMTVALDALLMHHNDPTLRERTLAEYHRRLAALGLFKASNQDDKAKRGLKRIHPQVIYWMRVSEALSFDEYWNDARFAAKHPQIPGPKMRMVGDRTYRHEVGSDRWLFDLSMHYLPPAAQGAGGHVARDTAVDRILLGDAFTYWGDTGPKVPDPLLGLFPNPRGQKKPPAGPLLTELHQLIDLDNPLGVVGDPADWNNTRYFPPTW